MPPPKPTPFFRAVATGQVLRYLPDHLFPSYLNACQSRSFENGRSLSRSSLTSPSSAVAGYSDLIYYDETRHLDSRYPSECTRNALRWSKNPKFSWGACPQTPLAHARCALVMQMPRPAWAIILYLTTQTFVATALFFVPLQNIVYKACVHDKDIDNLCTSPILIESPLPMNDEFPMKLQFEMVIAVEFVSCSNARNRPPPLSYPST